MKTPEEILDSKLHFAGAVKYRILEAMKEYAIACCEEQKFQDANCILMSGDIDMSASAYQSVIKNKNVAE